MPLKELVTVHVSRRFRVQRVDTEVESFRRFRRLGQQTHEALQFFVFQSITPRVYVRHIDEGSREDVCLQPYLRTHAANENDDYRVDLPLQERSRQLACGLLDPKRT